jgi:hypothetical protein
MLLLLLLRCSEPHPLQGPGACSGGALEARDDGEPLSLHSQPSTRHPEIIWGGNLQVQILTLALVQVAFAGSS